MYRGSLFLLQKDYKVHIPVVKELLNEKYDVLAGIDCIGFKDDSNQKLLQDINSFLEQYYDKIRHKVKEQELKNQLSFTLITKILMGTLGCVPAYDRYFIAGIKNQKVATGNYNIRSVMQLVNFYEKNADRLEPVREKMEVEGMPYPQMKMIDMGFWQIGFDLDKNKGIKNAHKEKCMDRFSEKSLLSLGDYYVYGLIDPRSKQIFYIGKGTKNRVFEHEKESLGSPDSEKLKLKTIADIKNAGFEVEKIIINSNLTEEEAFAAEASLINAFNYVGDAGLTNIVAGHHSAEALSVDEYERINGAVPLEEKDIRNKILVIKINRLYQRGMDEKVLYDAVRGVWRVSKEKVRTVEYVFGVYNSLIVAVYKPSEWFVCKEAKDRLPRQDIVLTPKTENRLFFVDERYEQGFPLDENESFYIGKSIAGLQLNQSVQNPITYLYPLEKDKIYI